LPVPRSCRLAHLLASYEPRRQWTLLGVLVAPLLGCAGRSLSPALARIPRDHPAATFEATLRGCGSRQVAARRFGRELRTAVLWGRQAVDSARVLPCEAVIEAVESGTRRPVYRILRQSSGAVEEAIPGRP
jgi:hypothetical protein